MIKGRRASAAEYEFDSPSLHAGASRRRQRPAKAKLQALRPMVGQRVGGAADFELKAQLALAVFNFSETPSDRPLHGFTPDADGPAVTPIPVATSFVHQLRAPPPNQAQQTSESISTVMPPPQTTTAGTSDKRPKTDSPELLPHCSPSPTAVPPAGTPSAAHLLKIRAARTAQMTPLKAAQTPPAASGTLCGLLWEPMETDGSVPMRAPTRVPTKTTDLPPTHKFEINDLLDENEDPFGW